MFIARSMFAFGVFALSVTMLGSIAAQAETYELDPVHSTFQFRVKHLGVSFAYGRFNDSKGSFVLDPNDPSKNSIEVEIQTKSVDTANKMRDEHLAGPDFFDVAKYPTMSFKSTSFTKKSDTTYEVAGDLTIRGVTKPVKFDATLVGTGPGMKGERRAGWEATLVIDRTEYGMTYGTEGIGTEVTLQIAIEGVTK
ncbi:MAG: YceI family protein [Candidatus Hydrogenedentes bacterium]|nr:YceI family protein [Candidatus Hydrogenedentota bacterium]